MHTVENLEVTGGQWRVLNVVIGDSLPKKFCDTAVFKEFIERVFGIEVCIPCVPTMIWLVQVYCVSGMTIESLAEKLEKRNLKEQDEWVLRLEAQLKRARGKGKVWVWGQQNSQNGDKAAAASRVAKALRKCVCSLIDYGPHCPACRLASDRGCKVLFSGMWAGQQARADERTGKKRQREVNDLDKQMLQMSERGRRWDFLPIECDTVRCVSKADLKHFTKQGAKKIFVEIKDQLEQFFLKGHI